MTFDDLVDYEKASLRAKRRIAAYEKRRREEGSSWPYYLFLALILGLWGLVAG